MTAIAPYRPSFAPGKAGFAQALRAEWTKFRTVRGWLIGALVGVLLMIGVGVLGAEGGGSSCQAVGAQGQGNGGSCGTGISFTLGPGGEPVSDSFYFVRQPLSGDGTITVRLTSLTGLVQGPPSPQGNGNPAVPGVAAWAKAGLIIKENLNQGSAYAALMVAAGHGVRLQWNYTGDTAGLPGQVGPASPRWLRLASRHGVVEGKTEAHLAGAIGGNRRVNLLDVVAALGNRLAAALQPRADLLDLGTRVLQRIVPIPFRREPFGREEGGGIAIEAAGVDRARQRGEPHEAFPHRPAELEDDDGVLHGGVLCCGFC